MVTGFPPGIGGTKPVVGSGGGDPPAGKGGNDPAGPDGLAGFGAVGLLAGKVVVAPPLPGMVAGFGLTGGAELGTTLGSAAFSSSLVLPASFKPSATFSTPGNCCTDCTAAWRAASSGTSPVSSRQPASIWRTDISNPFRFRSSRNRIRARSVSGTCSRTLRF